MFCREENGQYEDPLVSVRALKLNQSGDNHDIGKINWHFTTENEIFALRRSMNRMNVRLKNAVVEKKNINKIISPIPLVLHTLWFNGNGPWDTHHANLLVEFFISFPKSNHEVKHKQIEF